MGRLWSSGFELQSLTAGMEFSNVATTSGSINTTTKRSGAASLRVLNPSGATGYAAHQVSALASTEYYIRIYIYVAAAPNGETSILSVASGVSTRRAGILLNSSRQLVLRVGTTLVGTSSAINTSQWYRLEFRVNGATNTADVRLDGVSILSTTTTAFGGTYNTIIAGEWFNTVSSADTYFDDWAINDTSGSSQNSWPGEGSIVHLLPNATGDSNTALVVGGGTTWGSLDEITPNDATDYVVIESNGDILDVNVESSSTVGIGATDTVNLVQVGMRWRAASASTCSLQARIKSDSGGTVLSGINRTHGTTSFVTNASTALRNYSLTSYTDPTTGVAWTPTGTNSLDNMQIGLTSSDAAPDPEVTALWALVEYVPGATSTPISVSDTGTGAEAAELATTLTRTDSGGPGQELAVQVTAPTRTDSSTGTDSPLVSIPLGVADTALGTEVASFLATILRTDSSTSAESVASVLALVLVDENSSANEALSLLASFLRSDTGTGADVASAVPALAIGDAGAGSTALSVLASLTRSDAGTGAETLARAVFFTLAENGLASDLVAVLAALVTSDTGIGTEGASVAVPTSTTDTGNAAEALSLLAQLAQADSATAGEALAVLAALTRSDVGAGADAASIAVPITTADNGTLNQELINVLSAVLRTDAGTSSEALSLFITRLLADSGIGADSSSGSASITAEDTGAGAESITLELAAVLIDNGSGTELVTIPAEFSVVTVPDTGVGLDAATVLLITFVTKRRAAPKTSPNRGGVRALIWKIAPPKG